MFKFLFVVLISVVFVFGAAKLSFASSCHGGKGHGKKAKERSGHEYSQVQTSQAQKAVNVGNKICPVSGEKIDEKLKATYEYEEKVYNFCCASCIEEFKKDPSKYIKIAEEELQSDSLTK